MPLSKARVKLDEFEQKFIPFESRNLGKEELNLLIILLNVPIWMFKSCGEDEEEEERLMSPQDNLWVPFFSFAI